MAVIKVRERNKEKSRLDKLKGKVIKVVKVPPPNKPKKPAKPKVKPKKPSKADEQKRDLLTGRFA